MNNSDPFYGVMIEDCFVLYWEHQEETLRVICDFSLWPGNHAYVEPKNTSWKASYKLGEIILSKPEFLESFIPMNKAVQTMDPDGSIDYGCLDSIVISDKTIEIYGPFGIVKGKTQNLAFTYEIGSSAVT